MSRGVSLCGQARPHVSNVVAVCSLRTYVDEEQSHVRGPCGCSVLRRARGCVHIRYIVRSYVGVCGESWQAPMCTCVFHLRAVHLYVA